MATPQTSVEPTQAGLNEREMARLARFERCSEKELAALGAQAIAEYRTLMLRYACAAAAGLAHGPSRDAA